MLTDSVSTAMSTGLGNWPQAAIGVSFAVFVYGVVFVAGRVRGAFREASRTLDSVDTSLASIASSLNTLLDLQTRKQEQSQSNQVAMVSLTVVVDGVEVFAAEPRTGEIGVGVFTIRNVGPEPVFLLGVTRTAQDGMPQSQGRLVAPHTSCDVHLRLDPGDPPLDVGKTTIWYRDLLGGHWLRGLEDPRARRSEAEPAPAEQAVGETMPPERDGRE